MPTFFSGSCLSMTAACLATYSSILRVWTRVLCHSTSPNSVALPFEPFQLPVGRV